MNVLQVTKLHDAFMQLVQTANILALSTCILIVSMLLSGLENQDVHSNCASKAAGAVQGLLHLSHS
jgi:hypothetical protein